MPATRLTSLTQAVPNQGIYRYMLDYLDEHRGLLGEEPIPHSEFDRAVYATWFEGVRQGIFPEYRPVLEAARVEPRFTDQDEEFSARSSGFTVTLPVSAGNPFQIDFPLTYFETRANRHKAQLVRQEKLAADAVLRYRLTAFLDDGERAVPPPAIQLGSAVTAIRITEEPNSLSACEAWDTPEMSDVPVRFHQRLLEEAVEEARDHPEHEIGGFLLGHLRRAPAGDLWIEVTGLVSAHGTAETTAMTVTFTPESFARAHEMISLRAAGEVIVGHYHSHPFRVCNVCPLPMPPECVSKILFFSQDDVDLMTTTFAQPYMLGLLCAVEPRLDDVLGHLPVRLYGWRKGQLLARGFHVLVES